MSELMIDEIPASLNGIITEIDNTVKESGVPNEDEATWLYRNNNSKNDENIDNTIAPSIDEITTQEIDMRDKPTISLIGSQLHDDDDSDDDDDDDGIQVTIGNYEPEALAFQTNRSKNRAMLTTNPMMPPKPTIKGGVDFDAQGIINGQPTYEHDILNAYKDEEKPWKKPGADITDYFNYGFTEETWAQYCDRQRRLRGDNNLARLNVAYMPPMAPMISGHPSMGHPMNPHPMMMINKPMNMPMGPRPMNMRKPDGKIGVIGSTDQTSRRQMFEAPNDFEHPPFINGPPFPGGQPPNGQTVGDLISTPPGTNGHQQSHGTPPGGAHHIQTLGVHRLAMMPLPPGMQFRPQFGHPHAPGGPQFFPRGPMPGMHGDRPSQPYFVPRHPQQQWDKGGVPTMHGFPPGSFPPQPTVLPANNNGRAPSSRSPTPEHHSSRSSTPEENRPAASASGETEKSSKDDRYNERHRDDRNHHSSSRRRLSPKDRSSSSSYRSHHRGSEHEYERPRNDRKSSRDRDDKYERYSRKRHTDDSSRHHRGDDELPRDHRSSHRSPSKTNPNESSQTLNEQPEIVPEFDQPPPSSSSPINRSFRGDPERSSSRHSHHKKSSKRSKHDSGDERSSGHHHHHRRSRDKSSSNNKKSTNQTESVFDVKEKINE